MKIIVIYLFFDISDELKCYNYINNKINILIQSSKLKESILESNLEKLFCSKNKKYESIHYIILIC